MHQYVVLKYSDTISVNILCTKAVSIHWNGLLDWTSYWTGLLDSPKMVQNVFSSLFQCRREANHVYSAYFFAKFM